MLNQYSVIDEVRNRQYLLEKTQHLVGGFGKGPGDPPGKDEAHIPTLRAISLTSLDLLHSYFGMVSLAFQGEPGLRPVDPTLGATERMVQHLESLPWQ
jgi:geranylgeranyl transferase type-1 subunit beta